MKRTSWVASLEDPLAGVTATSRQFHSKAAEWGVGALMASADVKGAFDCVVHQRC